MPHILIPHTFCKAGNTVTRILHLFCLLNCLNIYILFMYRNIFCNFFHILSFFTAISYVMITICLDSLIWLEFSFSLFAYPLLFSCSIQRFINIRKSLEKYGSYQSARRLLSCFIFRRMTPVLLSQFCDGCYKFLSPW